MSFAFLAVIALAALLVSPIFIVAALRESRARSGHVAVPAPRATPVGAKLTAMRARSAAPANAGDRWGVGPDPQVWAPAVNQALVWSRAKQQKA